MVLAAAGLFALSGATCPLHWPPRSDLASLPPALSPSPSLEELIQVVNTNNGQIRSFSARNATLSGTGFPTLQATVDFQRPMRVRLRGYTRLTGPEIDLGSNDELFWFWVRASQPPALYYCRHERFAASPLRRNLPIDPYWLVEALGTAELDPALAHQGPFRLPGGQLEIRTIHESPDGLATKVTIVDGRYGLILQQRLYDSRNQLVAVANLGRYRRDPGSGLLMPTLVELHVPATPPWQAFSLQIQLGNVQINRPMIGGEQLFAMPSYENSPPVDLSHLAPPPGAIAQ